MKLTLLTALLFISFSSFAQIKKGAIFIGGDIGLSGNNSKVESGLAESSGTTSVFYFSPVAGACIKDNLLLGAGLYFSNNVQKQNNVYDNQQASAKIKTHNYGLRFWLRKYYPLSKSFFLFLNGDVSGGIGRRSDNNNPAIFSNATMNSVSISISAYPGVSFQMKRNFFLDASLNNLLSSNYNHEKFKQTNVDGTVITRTNKNYGFSSSIGNGSNPLQLGVRWIIAK